MPSRGVNGAASTLWVARHGERIDFADPLWRQTAARPFDPPLSPCGVVQAQQLARRLRSEAIAYVFASPFLRAVETASQAARALKLPLRIEHGLCEWLNADWFPDLPDYLSPSQMAELFPMVDVDYVPLVAPRHTETWDEMVARTAATAVALADRFPGEVLLVGHGATVLGLCEALLEEHPERVTAPLCGLTKLVRTGEGWRLEANADTSHLAAPQDGLRFI
jgi:broad specificity phosphatase PhoE